MTIVASICWRCRAGSGAPAEQLFGIAGVDRLLRTDAERGADLASPGIDALASGAT
jgi:hypothetical protein